VLKREEANWRRISYSFDQNSADNDKAKLDSFEQETSRKLRRMLVRIYFALFLIVASRS
jgi:hypothetical protein